MEPHSQPITWAIHGVSVLAIAVVTIAFLAILLWKRKRRDASERAPQREKILRPAGHYASCKLDELFERLITNFTIACASAAIFTILARPLYQLAEGLLAGRFALRDLYSSPLSTSVASLGLICVGSGLGLCWSIRRAWLTDDQIRNWRLGLRGEQTVAEKLASPTLARAGYTAFHDVPGDGKWNIDHVVVGPGGVFVLETKARARRKPTRDQAEHIVYFDGKILDFPWCYDDKAVRQVQRNADWLRQLLAEYAPRDLLIQPVIVVPGWFVQSRENPKDYPVKAMNALTVVSYIAEARPIYSDADLRAIKKRLDEQCRTLEF